MADMARVEQVKAEAAAAEMARLIAADVVWAMQRLGFDGIVHPPGEARTPDTRYGRLLVTLARVTIEQLEREAGY